MAITVMRFVSNLAWNKQTRGREEKKTRRRRLKPEVLLALPSHERGMLPPWEGSWFWSICKSRPKGRWLPRSQRCSPQALQKMTSPAGWLQFQWLRYSEMCEAMQDMCAHWLDWNWRKALMNYIQLIKFFILQLLKLKETGNYWN